jgi:hypothetical protein
LKKSCVQSTLRKKANPCQFTPIREWIAPARK